MNVLLDTHVWLWMQVTPERLGSDAVVVVEDLANVLWLSAASSWEIAIKFRLGKLPLPEPPATYVPARMQTSGVAPLHIEHRHTLRVADLELYHRDPFDRILIAQAQIENARILTADEQFRKYDVELIPAGT